MSGSLRGPRSAVSYAVGMLCRVAGRRQVVRAARFALHRARLDVPNDPRTNGEYRLQRWVLAALPPPEPVTVLDVGANVGEWSATLLEQSERAGHRRTMSLHAFEPAPAAHQRLAARLPVTATVNCLAVSGATGNATLHVVGAVAGTNSLHAVAGRSGAPRTVPVETTTIDAYLQAKGISRVHLLKVDTEGHDFAVLCGAEQSFQAQAIQVAQFEYNHRWVYARHFLKDVFDLLAPCGYRIGKLTPYGIEAYPAWDPELETFVEGNYVACTPQLAHRLPQVAWWKHAGRAG